MFSFIIRVRVRVSYRVRVYGLRLGFGIDNLKKYLTIFDRWRCKHIGHSLSLDACVLIKGGRCVRKIDVRFGDRRLINIVLRISTPA